MTNPGLCPTCTHTQNCIYQSNTHMPTWECQEYERYEPSVQPSMRPVHSSPQKPKAYRDNSVLCKGLCQTCNYRESCTYPHPEAGVWHCEEYQ